MKYIALLIVLSVATACTTPTTTAPEDSTPSQPSSVSADSEESSPETSITAAEPTPAAGPLLSGTFEAAEHPTTGTATIIQEGDQRYVEFSDDFSTDPGPDLFVVLHQSDNFLSAASPPAYGIDEGSYVSISPLTQVSGTQRYTIPASVDIDEYGSVAIWCRQFNATFGAANLQ
ncbi:MAG: DM13 domain-containing protein [Elainellaceae cyanobacterium]